MNRKFLDKPGVARLQRIVDAMEGPLYVCWARVMLAAYRAGPIADDYRAYATVAAIVARRDLAVNIDRMTLELQEMQAA